jgi:hypothetical protein
MFVDPAVSVDGAPMEFIPSPTGVNAFAPLAPWSTAATSNYGQASSFMRYELSGGHTYSFGCIIYVNTEAAVSLSPYCEVLVMIHRP